VKFSHGNRVAANLADCPALLVMTSRVGGYPLDQSWRIAAGECPLMTIEEARSRIRRALDLVRTVGVTFIGPLVLAIEASLTDDACRCLAAPAEVEAILGAKPSSARRPSQCSMRLRKSSSGSDSNEPIDRKTNQAAYARRDRQRAPRAS
jgi:hypothetical protein